jgi:hypothetical protein
MIDLFLSNGKRYQARLTPAFAEVGEANIEHLNRHIDVFGCRPGPFDIFL